MSTPPQPPTAYNRDEIRARLRDTPLRIGQIDVNGKCNAKCWYCPVKYQGNPAEFAVQMPLDQLERILGNLRASPLIVPDLRFLYSCHYNEVLIYRHFAEMLGLLRRHRFATMILSNGTPLTPEKTDLIVANKDVVWGVTLNIPALDKDDWARKAGLPASMHKLLLRNLDYLHDKYPALIQINSATSEQGLLNQGIGNSKAEGEKIANDFRERYPKFQVRLQEWLSDRAGKLEALDVLTRKKAVRNRVVGCSHSVNQGSRVYGWFHINAKGELFLCCDDYEMEYRFGNLLDKPFKDIWLSDEHVEAIERAQNGLCLNCQFRVEAAEPAG